MSIESLRKRFDEDVKKNPSLYHQIDIDRVRNEDWQVKRFLDDCENDEDKAFELLIKAMRWKKEFGIHERDDEYFPTEFWELSGADICGLDKQGRYIQLEVISKQHFFKELTLQNRQFFAHNLEKIDRLAGEKGFILISDTNGAGISNIDMDFTKFKMQCNDLYPGGLRQMFVVDLPWLLNPVMKVIVSFMNPKIQSKLTYIKKEQLTDYMEIDKIPARLKGKREKANIPDNLPRMNDIGIERFGLTDKFIDQFYSYHKIPRVIK